MANILTIADFVGLHYTAEKAFPTDKLNDFIEECQEDTLRSVLGDEMANEVQTTLPTLESKYNDLINGILWTDKNGIVYKNAGLKKVLLGFTYFKLVGDNFTNSSTGMVRNHNENSSRLAPGQVTHNVNSRYNRASLLYDNDIWPFLRYYRQSSAIVTSSVDNTGTYTLTVPNTLYLENEDIVTIGNTEYIASNVILNTSFDITEATAGLDFSGDTYKWEPFKDIRYYNFGITL